MKKMTMALIIGCLLLGAATAQAGGGDETVYEVTVRIIAKDDLKGYGYVETQSITVIGASMGEQVRADCMPMVNFVGQQRDNVWAKYIDTVCSFPDGIGSSKTVAITKRVCAYQDSPSPECPTFSSESILTTGLSKIDVSYGKNDM